MCIRDRNCGDEIGRTGDEINSDIAVDGVASCSLNVFPKESVSYTHLRAHETVLDIVCRLLLEKKNTAETKQLYAV